MASRGKNQATKGQALMMGVFASLLFISQIVAVSFEGRPITFTFWASVVIYMGFLSYCIWAYVRAVKRPPTQV